VATHDPFLTTRWTGYRVWALYGYLMDTDHDMAFIEKVKASIANGELANSHQDKDLYAIQITKDGYSWWETHGNRWDGYFDTEPNSPSRQRLKV
jgi:hypothetical protein